MQRHIKLINKCFTETLPLNVQKIAIFFLQANFSYGTRVIKSLCMKIVLNLSFNINLHVQCKIGLTARNKI
jgi:hypothetical protein